MVYLKTFTSFLEAAEKIYSDSPSQTRYSMKFNRDGANVVLKVTDDKTVVSYKLVEKEELRRMDEMNARFLHWCVERDFSEEDVRQAHHLKLQSQHQSTQAQQAQKRKPQQSNQSKSKKKR